jgi:hypothetical protein
MSCSELLAVVLSDTEDVQSDLVRELTLLEEVLQPLLGRYRSTGGRISSRLSEREDADLHLHAVCWPDAHRDSVSERRSTGAAFGQSR